MTICEYLNEEIPFADEELKWEDYSTGKITIEQEDPDLYVQIWETVNQWAFDNAEICCEEDAEFITAFLNDTLKFLAGMINEKFSTDMINNKKNHSYFDIHIAFFASAYARCYYFTEHPSYGNELFRQCQFTVNKFVSYAALGNYNEVKLSDILDCKPHIDPWEIM